MTNDLSTVLMNNRSKVDRLKLVQLAVSDDSSGLANDLMSKDIPTQLKAFQLATAKAELVRIIQLTDALNKLEDTYISRAMEDKDGMDMRMLSGVITTITNSLNRSMDIIDRITHDDDLQVIIDQSTKVIHNTNTVSLITNQQSREKLRNITSKLLKALNKSDEENSDTNNPNIIDVSPNKEGDS